MGFWTQAADGGYEKMSEGIHWLRIIKTKWEKKDGSEYRSKEGDLQMLLIVENQDAEQGTIMVTLSEKAAWVLARLLKHSGANLDRMEAEGVTLANFTNQKFADTQLVGRQFWGECKHKGTNANITTIAEEDVSASDLKKKGVSSQHQEPNRQQRPAPQQGNHQPIDDPSIPF